MKNPIFSDLGSKTDEQRQFIANSISIEAIVYLKVACLTMLRNKGDGLGIRCVKKLF